MSDGAHYLRPNDSSRTPTTLIAIGVSTEKVKAGNAHYCGGERLGVAVGISLRIERGRGTRRDRVVTNQPRDLWRWAAQHCAGNRTAWVFAIGGLRTATVSDFWAEIEDRRFTLWDRVDDRGVKRHLVGDKRQRRKGYVCAEKDRFICEVRTGRGRIKFVGIENYIDAATEQIADWCAIPQLPCGTGEGEPVSMEGRATWRAIVTLAAAVKLTTFWRSGDHGTFAATASGLAWNNYRHKHMEHQVLIHAYEHIQDLEKRSFRGGYVSCRWVGYWPGNLPDGGRAAGSASGGINYCRDGPVYQVDIRSHYPGVMASGLYPIHLRGERRGIGVAELGRLCGCYAVCASVKVKRRDRLPVDSGAGGDGCGSEFHWIVLPGPELELALAAGDVVAVDHVAYYSRARMFRSFVYYWWERRLAAIRRGDLCEDVLCKAVLDSLYGRWAMKARRWKDRPDVHLYNEWGPAAWWDEDNQAWTKMRSIGGHSQECLTDGWGENAAIAIAAFVTSYGRVALRRLIGLLPQRSLLYAHTDGMLITKEGHLALERQGVYRPDELGGLRVVGVWDRGEIAGPGNYRLGDTVRRAGCKDGAARPVRGGVYYDRGQSGNEVLARRPDGTYWTVPGRFGFDECRDPGPLDFEGFVIDELNEDQA